LNNKYGVGGTYKNNLNTGNIGNTSSSTINLSKNNSTGSKDKDNTPININNNVKNNTLCKIYNIILSD
jgi:hypothetical protein